MHQPGKTLRSPSLARTSTTHPLRIDAVPAGTAGGQIGITFCPGKCGPSAGSHRWERDLATDLDVIRAWGPRAVLTLVEDHELRMLGVPTLGQAVRALGIEWHHLPIVDVSPPDERFETRWREASPGVHEVLQDGGKVLVHCRGGLGRAGTVAAMILVEQGVDAAEAIRQVRAVRPGAIETGAQERYVLAKRWQGRSGTYGRPQGS